MKFFAIKKSLSLLIIAFSLSGPLFAESEVEEARAQMEQDFETLIATVQDETLSPDSKRALVERQLSNRLFLGMMTLQSLGVQAAYFNLQEFAEFSQEFEKNLLNFYLTRSATYNGPGIEIVSASLDEENGQVIIKTLGGERKSLFQDKSAKKAKRAEVEYHLGKFNGEWRIVKIIINGVDIDSNFQSQLNSSLKRKSPGEIIDLLRKSNQKSEKQNPFEKR